MVEEALKEMEGETLWREVHSPTWGDVDMIVGNMQVENALVAFERVLAVCFGEQGYVGPNPEASGKQTTPGMGTKGVTTAVV